MGKIMNLRKRKNESEIDKWLKEGEENGEIAIDTETSSLDAHQGKVIPD